MPTLSLISRLVNPVGLWATANKIFAARATDWTRGRTVSTSVSFARTGVSSFCDAPAVVFLVLFPFKIVLLSQQWALVQAMVRLRVYTGSGEDIEEDNNVCDLERHCVADY